MSQRNNAGLYVPDNLGPNKKDLRRYTDRPGTHALVKITLECGHVLRFRAHPPGKKDQVWCFSCDDYRERVK